MKKNELGEIKNLITFDNLFILIGAIALSFFVIITGVLILGHFKDDMSTIAKICYSLSILISSIIITYVFLIKVGIIPKEERII
jgi:hypothetical protein